MDENHTKSPSQIQDTNTSILLPSDEPVGGVPSPSYEHAAALYESKKYTEAIAMTQALLKQSGNEDSEHNAFILMAKCNLMLGEKILARNNLLKIYEQTQRPDIKALIDSIQYDEAENIAYKHDLDLKRVRLGLQLRAQLKEMSVKVLMEKQKWYVVPCSWLAEFKAYVFYDVILGTQEEVRNREPKYPGPLSSDHLKAPFNAQVTLVDADKLWESESLKPGLMEQSDYILMPDSLFQLSVANFGIVGRPILRQTMKQLDNEVVVEVHLRQIPVVVMPSSWFRFTGYRVINVSRADKISQLFDKIVKILNAYLYSVDRKAKPFSKVKLWKYHNNQVQEIMDLEKLWASSQKQVLIDAVELKSTSEETVDEMEIANDDILIIELPFKKSHFKFKASRATVNFSDFAPGNGPQELD